MSVLSNYTRTIGGRALPATIYLFVALLYSICGKIGVNVNIIRVLYGLYYILSAYYFVKVHSEGYLPKYFKALEAFVIVIFLYVIINIASRGMNPIGSFGNVDFLWWHIQAIAPIYPFYYFGRKNIVSNKWFASVFVFCFITVYIAYQAYLRKQMEMDIWERTEFTNNMGYLMISLLPMTMFPTKKKYIQYVCIGIVAFFVIMSFKRGAIVCLLLSLLFFINNEFKSSGRMSQTKRASILLLTFVGVVMLYLFIMRLYDTSDYFVARIEQTKLGDEVGRGRIYSYYLDTFLSGSVFEILFGRGVLATIHTLSLGIEAHNDWLEYAIDTGLVGVLFYFYYWKSFINVYFKSKRYYDDEVRLALGIVIITYLVRSFVSMSFYDMQFYSNIVLGYCIAKVNTHNRFVTQ